MFFSVQTIASEMSSRKDADLTYWNVDTKSGLYANNEITAASVTVNGLDKTLKLVVRGKPFCPEGSMCPAVEYLPIEIKITNYQVNSEDLCGRIKYVAQIDGRLHDGNLEKLTVVDAKDFNKYCDSPVAVPPTSVYYETTSSGFNSEGVVVKTMSSFFGNALQKSTAE